MPLDGPMARRLDVVRLQPDWSGDVLDLVVDFVTYVFVPAYAITASGLLLPLAAPLLGIGIAVSGALYFADRRMKSADNHFRGFPGLWNIAAFYLFLLHWPPALSSLVVAILIVATFLPFHVIHPVRVVRLRWLTLIADGGRGRVLAIYALIDGFQRRGARHRRALPDRGLCRGERRRHPAAAIAQGMIASAHQSGSLGGAADADRARDRARHRQRHLPVGDRRADSASRRPVARARSGLRWRWCSASCC